MRILDGEMQFMLRLTISLTLIMPPSATSYSISTNSSRTPTSTV